LILKKRVGCLPVVDDSNVLLGIITSSAFVELAVSLVPEAP
jgi:CBS domain-containing protein